MTCMSGNDECTSENFGDSSQLTNLILDYGATFYMTPEVSYFIPGSLKDTDKYIEVVDRHHVTAKQKGQVQIKMCDDSGDLFIATLHNVFLTPDLCNKLFSIITLMNSGYNCLFQKGFCTVYFKAKENNAFTLAHIAQMKHTFLGKIKEMSKKKKSPARNKIVLELLYQRLDHRSTR